MTQELTRRYAKELLDKIHSPQSTFELVEDEDGVCMNYDKIFFSETTMTLALMFRYLEIFWTIEVVQSLKIS